MSQWAIILAGGSGTRFWPVSTPSIPKQFLDLTGQGPLVKLASDRLRGLIPHQHVIVVTGATNVARTRELLPDVPHENFLIEPRAASTAPALTWATWVAQQRDPNAVVLSVHADWSVADEDGFRTVAQQALTAAQQHDVLITVGVVPTRPDTGFGYIQPGETLDPAVRRVKQFFEKPAAVDAARLIADGALWNSGMFAWTATRFLTETRAQSPEISIALPHLDEGNVEGFFNAVKPIAIDHSHYERSGNVGVVAGDFGWDDVGTWPALARIRQPDDHANITVGECFLNGSHGCIAWASGGPVVLDGVQDLVVVRANGVTFVTTIERASDLKSLIERLPDTIRNPADPQD